VTHADLGSAPRVLTAPSREQEASGRPARALPPIAASLKEDITASLKTTLAPAEIGKEAAKGLPNAEALGKQLPSAEALGRQLPNAEALAKQTRSKTRGSRDKPQPASYRNRESTPSGLEARIADAAKPK